jgi:hypothetical protein
MDPLGMVHVDTLATELGIDVSATTILDAVREEDASKERQMKQKEMLKRQRVSPRLLGYPS